MIKRTTLAQPQDFLKGRTKTIYAVVLTNRNLERQYLGYYEDKVDAEEAYLGCVNYTPQWQPSIIELILNCRSH